MKRVQLFSLIALAILLFACAKEESFPEGLIVSSDFEDIAVPGNALSVQQALDEVQNFCKEVDQGRRPIRRARAVDLLKRSDLHVLTRAEEDAPLAYVFNFADDEGYAVVALDGREVPIIMVGDKGSFSLDAYRDHVRKVREEATRSSGPSVSSASFDPKEPIVDMTEEEVQAFQYDLISAGLTNLLPGINLYNDDDAANTIVRGDSLIFYQKPLVLTKWGQSEPYNQSLAAEYSGYPVGCGGLALAQILAANAYNNTGLSRPDIIEGTKIDWNKVLSTIPYYGYLHNYADMLPEETKAVADLIAACCRLERTRYTKDMRGKMKGSVKADSVVMAYKKLGFINPRLVKCQDSTTSYVHRILMHVYNAKQPLLALSINLLTLDRSEKKVGHAFVFEGVKYYVTTEKKAQFYVHCNFGIKGYYDGYYLLNIFEEISKNTSIGEKGDDGIPYPHIISQVYFIDYEIE